jgi:hypothetical protein
MSTTTPHPAHMFTVGQANVHNTEVRSKMEAWRASLLTPRPKPQDLPLTVYRNADEACDARHNYEAQPDAERQLADAHEAQFELCELISSMEMILNSNPSEHERRKLLGHEERKKPSLPGIVDEYFHVDGTLDRARARLAEVEKQLPRLELRAAEYRRVKQSLAPWPWARINRERNAELDRQIIVGGQMPLKRGRPL